MPSKRKLRKNPKAIFNGFEYDLSKMKVSELRTDHKPVEISLVVGAIIIILIIWGVKTYGD